MQRDTAHDYSETYTVPRTNAPVTSSSHCELTVSLLSGNYPAKVASDNQGKIQTSSAGLPKEEEVL